MRKSTPAFTFVLVVSVMCISGVLSNTLRADTMDNPEPFHYESLEMNTISSIAEEDGDSMFSADALSVSCIDQIHLSLDENCEVIISPTAIIREMIDPANLSMIIEDEKGNILSNPITIAHLKKNLKVTVTNTLTGVSCWGNVLIEDKYPPLFECPQDTVVSCYFHEPLRLPIAFDNCDSTAYVAIVFDEIINQGCSQEYSAIRTVVYQSFDKWGNKSEPCTQTIYYRRLSVEDIVFPPNYDSLEMSRPYLACDDRGIWDLNNNYYPDPWVDLNKNGKLDPGEIETDVPRTVEGYPIVPNKSYCEIESKYKDIVLDICENSFKVLREWKILDWCSNDIRTHYQIIKVLDDAPPVITCPPVQTLEADPWTCTADYKVLPPIVIFDCSSTNYTVEYKEGNALGTLPGDDVPWVTDKVEVVLNSKGEFDHFIIRELLLGRTWVRYTVTDDCGNSTQCTTEVDVVDKSQPTAVCLEITNVRLDDSGFAKIYATSLDNGSYDQCTDVYFEVRRKGAPFSEPLCEGKDPNDWAEFVAVCCEDAGKIIEVEFRVWDDADLDGVFGSEGDFYSTCWVKIHVENKTPPVLNIPSDITLHCTEDFNDLELTGKATAEGICGPLETSFIQTGAVNSCGEGVINRIWSIVNPNVAVPSRVQRITVTNKYPFDGYKDIKWPQDTTLFGCLRKDTDPENLPHGYNFPKITPDDCTTIATSYKDQVLSSVEDVCFKIIRTWTVIDWCKYEASQRTQGIWSHIQVIKVNETEAPVINLTSNLTVCTFSEDCEGFIELINTAEDCTPLKDQKWTFEIDPFNDGEGPFITGNSNNASGIYPVGTHRITWTVKDQCGNLSTATHLFTIQDCKKPTPYCITELTTVIMPSTGTIEVWAVDFDRGSEDNCPGPLQFTFNGMFPVASLINQVHFKGYGLIATEAEYLSSQAQKWLPSSHSSAVLISCNNVGINELQMWVRDVQGNADFCNIRLNIQANDGCDNEASARVGGRVSTVDHIDVAGAEVTLLDMNSNKKTTHLTGADGRFEFKEIKMDGLYSLSAELDDDYRNGVSTLDILLIQRHILGIQPLNDPYKLIAADVNNSKTVTATDILQIRRLILGIYDQFPNNKSWKLLDNSYIFSDPSSPWDYVERIPLDQITKEMMNNEFVAVKVGDVDRSYSMNLRNVPLSSRSVKETRFYVNEKKYRTGDLIDVTFMSDENQILAGFQATIGFDAGYLEYMGFNENELSFNMNNVNENKANSGVLAISWNTSSEYESMPSQKLFTFRFRALKEGTLSSTLWLSDQIAASEAYTEQLEATRLSLNIIDDASFAGNTELLLMQNRPNPFLDQTIISFVLPNEGEASLTIFDISGRILYRNYGIYPAGQTDIIIQSQELPASGILYYQLEAQGNTISKKMIKVSK